ncbi:hypothetical protein TWF696_002917 [Orbilia brochopaga]|uniref:Major facilitator superfamily (MFS) profile domain-containing protein n=1 Tax=Orbilia brochopaga TaxID=3140254 RepID=A0AAV9U331_9PEZI
MESPENIPATISIGSNNTALPVPSGAESVLEYTPDQTTSAYKALQDPEGNRPSEEHTSRHDQEHHATANNSPDIDPEASLSTTADSSSATTIKVLESTNTSILVADDIRIVVQQKEDEESSCAASPEVLTFVARPDEGFPDGGRRAWLCVLGTWLCLFSAFGLMNAIGVFQAYYKQYLLPQYTESQLSWIMGSYLFVIFAGGVLAGTIFDIYGPRYLIIGGTMCLPFGMVLISISTQYWHLILAQSLLVGGGTAMTFYASISSVTTWFYHKRAMAIGIASTGGGVGGIFFPLVMSQSLRQFGFAWTTRLFGLVYLISLGIACFLVRSRLTHAKSLKARKIVLFDFAAFKEPAWSFFGIGCFVQLLGLWAPINYLASFALANGFSATMAFYMIAFLNGGSIFGRALPGILGDRFGRITTFIVFSTISGAFILTMWSQVHSRAGIMAFAILYGFSSGAFLSIYAACAAQLTKNVAIIGQRLGTLNVLTAISASDIWVAGRFKRLWSAYMVFWGHDAPRELFPGGSEVLRG